MCYKVTEIIKQRRNSLKMTVIGAFTLPLSTDFFFFSQNHGHADF